MASAQSIGAAERAAREHWAGGAMPRLVNVGRTERMASTIGGGVLVLAGLARGGLKGLIIGGLGAALIYRGTSGHCSLYQAMGANTAEGGESVGVPAQAGVRIEESIVIERPADDIYRYWRNYANVPEFMHQVQRVDDLGGGRSHWVLATPVGVTLEWDAEIHNDSPGELIAWRSLEGAQVQTAGSVHFSPDTAGRGTVVRVNQKMNPPGGKLGVALAGLVGDDPGALTRENLRTLKQIMEGGRVPSKRNS